MNENYKNLLFWNYHRRKYTHILLMYKSFLVNMAKKCLTCGTDLEHSCLTHCSEKCLFVNIQHSKSICNISIKRWI